MLQAQRESQIRFSKQPLRDQGQGIFNKTIFIGHHSDPVPLRSQYENYGTYYDIGLEGFLAHLQRAPLSTKVIPSLPNNFRPVRFVKNEDDRAVSRDEVRDEFLLGSLKNAHFSARTNFADQNPYYAQRDFQIPCRSVCVHGDTGNGKSVMSKQILFALSEQGFQVVEHTGGTVDAGQIARYVEAHESLIIFVEDVVGKLDSVRAIKATCPPSTIFVVTSKTKDYEIRRGDVHAALGGDLDVVSCNKLNQSEIVRLIDLLNVNYLWGDYSDADQTIKTFVIKEKCQAEMRGVLFALFDGGAIRTKMDDIFKRLSNLDKDHFDIISLNCLFNYSRIRNKEYFARLGSLDDLLNLRVDYDEFFKDLEQCGITEIFDRMTGDFNIKSAILSRYFIVNHLEIEGLLKLVTRCLRA